MLRSTTDSHMDQYGTGINLPDMDLESILVSDHGRQRRVSRRICEQELNLVIRYGKKKAAGQGRWQYTYGGVVVITDAKSRVVITTWVTPACGLDLQKVDITDKMRRDHDEAIRKRRVDMSSWTSHNVIVVDQSGSMRTTDSTEGVTRSDLVWLTLATVFVAEKIKSGERKPTDVMSVINMQGFGDIVIQAQPYDWILYNKLVDLLRTSEPKNHGNYLPSFDATKKLLRSNNYSGCALLLIFFSDGRPSDHCTTAGFSYDKHRVRNEIKREMGEVASYLGNRLTVGAIAIGEEESDEFTTLKYMVDAAKEYGSRGFFQSASLSADVLATALNSLTSTLTSTMIQMSEISGSKHRKFREFQTESLRNVGKHKLTNEFDTVYFRRTTTLHRTIVRINFDLKQGWTTVRPTALFHTPCAVGVAFKKRWFGCGAERLVKEFREIDKMGTFVGPCMVAKDTKYVRRGGNQDEKDFHYIFCKTQLKAQQYAQRFNHQLTRIEAHIGITLPRIEFLDCCVYMLERNGLDRRGYLVERMLDVERFEYQKWNLNNGWYKGCNEDETSSNKLKTVEKENLFTIIEDESLPVSDDEQGLEEASLESNNEEEDLAEEVLDSLADTYPKLDHHEDTLVNDEDIPQAFSCFTYYLTERQVVVCDLQGIFNTSICPPVFELTDPAIHHFESMQKNRHYGRSDKGRSGIDAFLLTHKCSNLCRFLQHRCLRGSCQPVVLSSLKVDI